jgi:ABC-type phosphate transport system substrate-binding protein
MKTTTILMTLLFILPMFILPMAMFSGVAGLKIIANPGAQTLELKKKDIRDIYTGVTKIWETDGKVIIAILEDSELHKQFLEEYVNKTPIQFRNYWREKVFTGEGESPKSFKTEKDLIDFVVNTKGAIGYISSPTEKAVTFVKITR